MNAETETKQLLKTAYKNLGKAGDTIHVLRGEVALLRQKEGVSQYADTLDYQHTEIVKLRRENARLQYDNEKLRKDAE